MSCYQKLGAVALLSLGLSSVAMAQAKPEDAIRARQSIMRVVALNFGPMASMAQDKTPYNKDMFLANAVRLEQVWAMDSAKYFAPGSDKPVAGSKIAGFTDAKAEVWSKGTEFKTAHDKTGQEIGKLVLLAKAGDEKAMKQQVGEIGKTCKGCHDNFKVQ
jgi:cytochrome c556